MKDLLPVGLIYTLIITSGMYFNSTYKTAKQEQQKLEAMQVAISVSKELEKSQKITNLSIDYLIKENLRLKNKLSEYKHVDSIVKDIHRIAE